jgi:hypothetical protein
MQRRGPRVFSPFYPPLAGSTIGEAGGHVLVSVGMALATAGVVVSGVCGAMMRGVLLGMLRACSGLVRLPGLGRP